MVVFAIADERRDGSAVDGHGACGQIDSLLSGWNGMIRSPVKLAVGDAESGASNEARLVELTELELRSSSTFMMAVMLPPPSTEN